ncbi:MAG: DNA repair protein RecO [bacterium]|nr:DNA repair protein RecO [bacterium]
MITHTQAIILKSVDYQESSKILTVLSQKHGKIALIARGVKRPKSKLAGVIDIGNILDVVYYYKPSRAVQSLTEASIQSGSMAFRKDFEKAAILYSVLELTGQLVHENEENEPLFSFLSVFVKWLSNSEFIHPSIFAYVQIRCAELLGFNLSFEQADTFEHMFFDISHGLISNEYQTELSYTLTVKQSRFLHQAIGSKSMKVLQIGLSGLELKQLIHHLDVYYKYHIDGYKDRKSDAIFEQMLKDI